MSDSISEIRTSASPSCYLCSTQGKELYVGLTDRLFGAPGIWTLKRCQNTACGLVWLDPMPRQEDISLAYRHYYTHQGDDVQKNTATLAAADKKINTGMGALAHRILRYVLLKATGISREQDVIRTRYLGGQTPGNLLEVGCGAGDYLALMRTLEWDVEGVEIDHAACQHARKKHGLTVHEGTLESKGYAENSFDAIVLNHVIEHVFDPIMLIRECRRVVKPGGKIILLTPNMESWGHRKFKKDWINLDPPRHIFLFSPKTMLACATAVGFKKIEVTTTPANAEFFMKASIDICKDGRFDMISSQTLNDGFMQKIIRKISVLQYQLQEYFSWKINPSLGDEVAMTCQK